MAAAGALLLSAAETLNVPVLWQNKSPKGKIQAIGVLIQPERYVFAFKIPELKDYDGKSVLGYSIYSDVDNDLNTGRFAGKSGWDFQLNIRLHQNKLMAMKWNAGDRDPVMIPLYSDDYLLIVKDEYLYVILRREPLGDVALGKRFSIRIVPVSIYLDQDQKKLGDFPPILFTTYGNESQAQKHTRDALQLTRSDGLVIWNNFGERYQESEKAPANMEKCAVFNISGAKGEAEALHLTLTTEKKLQSLQLFPAVLRSKDGKEIPASAMKITYPGFVRTLREESFNDILYPSFKPHASVNNFIQLQINIPRNAQAGIYEGTLPLTIDGKPAAPIPVKLQVYNFSMPERPFFKTAYCLKSPYIKNHFANVSLEEHRKEWQAIKRIAKEYRLSPRLLEVSPGKKWDGKNLQLDWRAFDRAAEEYFVQNKFTALQLVDFQMGSHMKFYNHRFDKIFGRAISQDDPEFQNFIGQLARQYADHLKEKKWLDRCFLVVWDEPYGSVYPQIAKTAATIRKNAPELKPGVFIGHMDNELAPHVDLWLSSFEALSRIRRTPSEKAKPVWCYNYAAMDHFRHPAAALRLQYFTAFKYNVSGYLYSEINGYTAPYRGTKADAFYNIWINYIWLYPGEKPGDTMPSLRLTLTREGLDDYDYLALYRQKFPGKALPEFVTAVMPELQATGDQKYPVTSQRQLQSARHKLAKLLEN